MSFVAAGGAAKPAHPGYLTDLPVSFYTGAVATVAFPAVDTLILVPYCAYHRFAAKAARFRVVALGAGSALKAGLWRGAAVGGRWRPIGLPIASNNTGAATTANNTTIDLVFGAPAELAPGELYFVGMRATGTLPTFISSTASAQLYNSILGGTPLTAALQGYSAAIAGETYATDIATTDLSGSVTWGDVTAGLPVPALIPA